MEKAPGGRPEKTRRAGRAVSDGTFLSDMGISYDQSAKWQRLADVPDDEFEAALVGPKPSTAGIHGPRHVYARQFVFRCATPRRSISSSIS
jgi:hypothetical protein